MHYAMRKHVFEAYATYADSDGPNQTAHPRILIRAFIARLRTRSTLGKYRLTTKTQIRRSPP